MRDDLSIPIPCLTKRKKIADKMTTKYNLGIPNRMQNEMVCKFV